MIVTIKIEDREVLKMIQDTAKWVSAGETCEAPIIFGKLFFTQNVTEAKISICGLGFFELYINGQKISKDILVPAWSDYEPRVNRRIAYPLNDTFNHRVYYMEYTITENLTIGENKIEIWLGNGWYNQHERNAEGDLWYDKPKLAYTVEITDKNGNKSYQHSDENLKWRPSPIYFNNVYFGEKWDYRFENLCDSHPVEVVAKPKAPLIKQTCPPDREIRNIIPEKIYGSDNKAVYDVGENITGYISCKGKGKIIIRYAEEIDKNCELDFLSAGGEGQIQCDEYYTEKERTLKPKFSVKGFRYFEVMGEVSDINVIVVHSDIPVTSYFESGNQILNWLYAAYIRTQLDNMHYGIVSDCPHRERLGYTGDGQITCNAAMLTLGCRDLYKKWIYDIMDCQCPETGHVQHTAPFYGGGGGPGGWGSAVVIVPFQYYMHYGDVDILKECYPYMIKWFYYMQSRMENDLIVAEEKGGWCLGEWCTPKQITIPEPLVNTYYFIKSMKIMLQVGEVIGCDINKKDITDQLVRSMTSIKEMYCKEPALQGSDAFLLDLGIGDERALESLNERYSKTGEYDTGIFGTPILTKVLFENGYADTAFNLLTSRADTSFYNMMKNGATTLWENWDGRESHNHPMFGAVTECLFEYILGIRPLSPGYEKIIIDPKEISGLSWAKGHITVKSGVIQVEYSRGENPFIKVTIPDVEGVIKLKDKLILLKKGENIFTKLD